MASLRYCIHSSKSHADLLRKSMIQVCFGIFENVQKSVDDIRLKAYNFYGHCIVQKVYGGRK